MGDCYHFVGFSARFMGGYYHFVGFCARFMGGYYHFTGFSARFMGETLNLQVFCTTNIHIFHVFRKFSCYVHKKLLKSENIYDNI
jgi:hypothetical protein